MIASATSHGKTTAPTGPTASSVDRNVALPETEWTADLRAAWEKLTAEHSAQIDAVLAPFVVFTCECRQPTVEEWAAHEREAAAREVREGTPRRRPEPPSPPLPPCEVLDAIEDERVPAALAHLAAMQGVLTARLLSAVRNPRATPA